MGKTPPDSPLLANLPPGLLPAGTHLLVALSGGADSVALLHALRGQAAARRWQLTAAHLDHGIRPGARADALFVRRLCRAWGVTCVVGRADVPGRARRQRISLEMAAREARYRFLRATASRVGADRIAVAHQADDQVETVLLRLIRGSGRAGLSGMGDVHDLGGIPVVRPLLGATRAQIERYLGEHALVWREDESNAETRHLRNRVRHVLLPLLETQFNPAIRDVLRRMAEVLGAEDAWMEHGVEEALKALGGAEGGLDVRRLRGLPLGARRRVILTWLRRQGVPEACLDFTHVEQVDALARDTRGSRVLEWGAPWRVERRYGQLRLIRKREAQGAGPVRPVRVRCPGVTLVPALAVKITVKRGCGIIRERGKGPGQLPARCSLDMAGARVRPLAVRAVRPGDRMAPYGMEGSRKLQDILVDAKVPRAERGRIPVMVCGAEVVWLPGYRIARGVAVGSGSSAAWQVTMERC